MLSEENTLNTGTQQFITAKISSCALKQGSKIHQWVRTIYNCKRRLANVLSNTSSRA